MYPAAFDYLEPGTVNEATALLREHGDRAKVVAGGQSLIPVMKLRFAMPEILIDINGIADLDSLEETDAGLRIGALVRHKTVERSPVATGRLAILADAARVISDPIVRNRGTLAGSLVHADPQGDWGSVMMALRAEVVAQGPSGTRSIPIDEFLVGPFMTTLADDELVIEVRVPSPPPSSAGTYLKLERKVGDYATAAVAVQVEFDNGKVGQAGIAMTGVGPQNVRATAAEDAIRGAELDDNAIAEAGRLAADAASPQDDIRGSVKYKRNVVRVFTERGLRTAAERVQAA